MRLLCQGAGARAGSLPNLDYGSKQASQCRLAGTKKGRDANG